MNFSEASAVQTLPGAFRARVKWKNNGRLHEVQGPRRPDRQTAENDLESMRAALSEQNDPLDR